MASGAFATGVVVFDRSPSESEEAADEQPNGTEPPGRQPWLEPKPTTSTTLTETGASSRAIEDRTAPSATRSLDVGCAEPVVVAAPAADLAAVVSGSEPHTCFLLQPGQYHFSDVVPKDYMTFLGTSRAEVKVAGSSSTENAFHGNATGVTVGRMTFTGFRGDGGTKAQEQAPIRGTVELWDSDRGTLATEWLIEDVESSNNIASGVFLGDNFTIRKSLFTDNGITGLGGSEIVGGLIEHNIIRGNGGQQATGYLGNGGGIKFTQAIAGGQPVTIRSNEISGNAGIGVWCDIACDGFHVISNYIHDQDSRAVMYELSRNAVIRDNLFVNANGWTDYKTDFNAGAVTIGESSDVTIENNFIEGAKSGVVIRQTRRPANSQEAFLEDYEHMNWVSEHVTVRKNVFVNVTAIGISLGTTGKGLIPDPGTIQFDENAYQDRDSIAFWLGDGTKVDFSSWQASGRDGASPQAVPDRTTWSARTP